MTLEEIETLRNQITTVSRESLLLEEKIQVLEKSCDKVALPIAECVKGSAPIAAEVGRSC